MMPKLPVNEMLCTAEISGEDREIIYACFNMNTQRLRSVRPFQSVDCDKFKSKVNYVWRMLCFSFCSNRPYSCMPVTADFDLCHFYWVQEKNGLIGKEERRTMEKETIKSLNDLIKRFEGTLPVTFQTGTMRWARAFGVV